MSELLHLFTIDFWVSFFHNPVFGGVLIEIAVILIIIFFYNFGHKLTHKEKDSRGISILLGLMFEKMYEFFEETLGENTASWIKSYVVNLFFVILIANLIGLSIDFLVYPFPFLEGKFINPTSDVSFNLEMAAISVLLTLYIQAKHLGFLHFLHEYIPILGKDIIPFEQGKMSPYIYYPIKAIIKVFDICISLFLGILDIVGIFAKVISLSFRLYGNMISGSILIGLLVGGVSSFTSNLMSGMELPVLFPIILYLQGLLVSFVQAFVFSLLISIFIKASVSTD